MTTFLHLNILNFENISLIKPTVGCSPPAKIILQKFERQNVYSMNNDDEEQDVDDERAQRDGDRS